MKHLIDPTDLTKQETDEIIALAEDIISHREKYQDRMAHRKLATLSRRCSSSEERCSDSPTPRTRP